MAVLYTPLTRNLVVEILRMCFVPVKHSALNCSTMIMSARKLCFSLSVGANAALIILISKIGIAAVLSHVWTNRTDLHMSHSTGGIYRYLWSV